MPRSLSQDSRGSYDSDKYSDYSDSFDSDEGRTTRSTRNETSSKKKYFLITYFQFTCMCIKNIEKNNQNNNN